MSAIIDPVIHDQLNRYARRQRWWILFQSSLIALAVWIIAVLLVTWIDAVWVIERGPRSLLTLAAYGSAAGVFLWMAVPRLRGEEPLRRAALAMEGARPEMRDRLLSAVELARAADKSRQAESTIGSIAFIEAAQRDVAFRISRLDVRELLPLRLLQRPMVIATVLFIAAISLAFIPSLNYGNRFARAIIPGIDLDRVSRTRIRITRPEPASRSVPAEELTAIAIETLDYPAEKATLQWQSDGGQRGSLSMNLVDDGESMSVLGEPMTRLAANLPVQQETMRYRILAGDGVTAWHTLAPRPRPTATQFEIAVAQPDYSRLPVKSITAESGDLRVIRGSQATIAVTFDMPVVDAFIRLVGDDSKVAMTGQGDRWSATVMVTQSDRYQVLARSAETGFDNPLSPQYSIIADIDQPPAVSWLETAKAQTGESADDSPAATESIAGPKKRLVTSRATVSLRATAADEMPVERLFQEVAINRGQWELRPLDETAEMTAKMDQQWAWDLASIAGENRSLNPGDLIRTRIVAVDRLGQRGESEVREYLISDQALDVRRRENVRAWADLAADVTRWQAAVAEEAIRLGIEKPKEKTAADSPVEDSFDDVKLPSIAEQSKSILAKLVTLTRSALHDSEAGEIELLARVISRVDTEIARADKVDTEKREPFKQVARAAQYVENAVEQSVAHRLAVTLAEDFDRMVLSMQPLADPDGAIQWQSFGPYHQVTQQQFRESLALIKDFEQRIPDSTVNHNEQIRRWIDGWLQRLSEHESPDVGEQRTRATTGDLIKDLSSRRRYGMIDGRLPSLIIESHNRLIDFAGWNIGPMQDAANLARDVRRLREGDAMKDSAKAIEATAMHQQLLNRLGEIGQQIKFDAEANLRRPGADRRYVADARLMQRVLDTIRADDFVLPENKKFDDVVEEIKTAFYQLEAGHWWTQWLTETRGLADTERWDIDTSTARIDAPMRWERIHRGLDQSLTGLDRSSVSWEIRQPLHNVVHGREQSKVSSTITSRRWQNMTATSLADSLDALHESLVASGQSIVPAMADARRRLEAYLPNLGEMARDTAKQLRVAEELAKEQKVQPKEAAETLNDLQKQIAEQADKLREALVDEANTQDLMNAEGLRKARDADIASRAIEQQMQAANEATEQAVQQASEAADEVTAEDALQTAAQPLADAAQTLEKIAEHYENQAKAASDAADPAAQPPSLASLEQILGLTNQLDQEFARSKALAEALQSDRREMLEKLSQELKRNELMRNELDKIAERSLQDAQQALTQAASRERELRLDLERQDPQIMAEKRRLEDAIRGAADNSEAVQRSMMHTAKQAAARLNSLPEPLAKQADAARSDLENAAQQLQQAIQSAAVQSAEQELLGDLRERATEVKDQLATAVETLAKSEAAIDSLRKNPESSVQGEQQKSEQRDMQNLQRQTRDTLAGAVRNLQNRASQLTSQSEQASRQAKAQEQQAQRQLGEVEKRLAKEPDNQDLKRDRARAEAKLEAEKQRVAVAEADIQRRRETVEKARERLAEIGRTPLLPLESLRPAAELVQSMQQRAAEDLKAQQAALEAAVQKSAAAPELKADSDQLQSTEQSQADVQAEVQRAAENLQRAARHQERLGDRDSAQLTASVADAVQNVANQEVAQAQAAISQAADDAMSKAEASERPVTDAQQSSESLGKAQQAIAQQAEALLEAIAQASRNAAQNAKQAENAGDQKATSAKQMAQTLDELDRSLTQSRQPQGEQSQDGQSQDGQPQDGQAQPPSDGQQPGQQAQSGQPGQQQPGGPSSQTNSPSPTLADAARRQMQQMAMNRTLPGEGQPSDSTGPQPGEGEPQDGQPGDGESQMSGPGNRGGDSQSFRLNDIAGGDDDWGKLRSLEAEDTSVQRRVDVSPEYRRQIEAYFRVIAERAREK